MAINRLNVENRVAELSLLIRAHAGGLELDDIAPDGVVHVRFTGMCTGCQYRPVTFAATVRPALLALDGVTGVHVAGSRISEEAEARVLDAIGKEGEANVLRLFGART